ncbi:YSIRK-type signal peptide-containing protein [Lactiplantibacillus plantarum]|uniref:YSIRK-type signal peptide-containing protein n=1 Tax=Lactiplantibacillus plantarum TaxID=1590 RepID=UPI0020067173|nr:YSIRK-type signal peptide-containing protein [Lactiplantibacillus plantarum]MCK6240531.1 YSIRK-type signal peptide-containing protein [Lactiplantibacillus plantarum]
MLGRNNVLMDERKKSEKITKWSIRKLKVGVSSVAIATGFLAFSGVKTAYADTPISTDSISNTVTVNNDSEPSTVNSNTHPDDVSKTANETVSSDAISLTTICTVVF